MAAMPRCQKGRRVTGGWEAEEVLKTCFICSWSMCQASGYSGMHGHIWAATKADRGHMHVDTQAYRQTHTDH